MLKVICEGVPDSDGSILKRSLKSDSITFPWNKVSNITVAVRSLPVTTLKRKSCLKTRANRRSVIRQVSLACPYMFGHKWMVDPGYTLQRAYEHARAFESDLSTAESRLAWHSQDGILLGWVRYAECLSVMLLRSLVFLRTLSRRQEATRTIIWKPGLSK